MPTGGAATKAESYTSDRRSSTPAQVASHEHPRGFRVSRVEEASAPAGPTCVGHLPPPAVGAEAVGGSCGDQLPEGSEALQGLRGAAVWITARSANRGGGREEGGGPQLNHLLKRLIRSSWAPVLVLTKTHWTGRKPPLSAHWGGVWGAELWSRRLDLTSQLPGPRGQRSSGEAGPPTTRSFLSRLLRLAGAGRVKGRTHSATASRSVWYRTAPSHPGQRTNTAPCWAHTEPLQRVLKVNT